MRMTVITTWNLHLLTALVCKTSLFKNLNKCTQNRRLPLDSALGKTSRAKTVVLPHVLEKGQPNWAILGLVANLFLNTSFLLRKVNNLYLIHVPNLASCVMFWEVNQKPLPPLTGGVSPFGCRCTQSQM